MHPILVEGIISVGGPGRWVGGPVGTCVPFVSFGRLPPTHSDRLASFPWASLSVTAAGFDLAAPVRGVPAFAPSCAQGPGLPITLLVHTPEE